AGWRSLTDIRAARTSAEMAAPAALDLNAAQIAPDALTPYPMLYWRITGDQRQVSPRAAAALSTYLHRGGVVVIDAPEQAGALGGHGAGAKLEEILRSIDLPPLIAMPEDHVLKHSFYLLPNLPGRFTDAPVYIERGSSANDG